MHMHFRKVCPEVLKVYTDQDNLTEKAFFWREAGMSLTIVDPKSLDYQEHSAENRIWIASAKPGLWYPLLEKCSAESVIFFYLGNELYEVVDLQLLIKHPSIYMLFVYAPPTKPSLINLFSVLFASIFDSGRTLRFDLVPYLRNFRTGVQVKQRLSNLEFKNGRILVEIPQGYSLSFAIQFKKMFPDLGNDDSLITYALNNISCSSGSDDFFSLCFIGQSGNLRRTRVLQLAEQKFQSGFYSKVKDYFGGNEESPNLEYIHALNKSHASLIPSGVFNNYNHRYCEALIMGKLPIVALNNLTDPNTNYYWVKKYPLILRDSYRWLFRRLKKMKLKRIQQIVVDARLEEFKRIRVFSDQVNAARIGSMK